MDEAMATEIGQRALDLLAPDLSEEFLDQVSHHEITAFDGRATICWYAASAESLEELQRFFAESAEIKIEGKVFPVDFLVLHSGGMH